MADLYYPKVIRLTEAAPESSIQISECKSNLLDYTYKPIVNPRQIEMQLKQLNLHPPQPPSERESQMMIDFTSRINQLDLKVNGIIKRPQLQLPQQSQPQPQPQQLQPLIQERASSSQPFRQLSNFDDNISFATGITQGQSTWKAKKL